ncbi:MAG: Gfo/Idh/MocA family oxidoreductase [Acidobacteria bacterium]|nr:Gfo/Idh/MocA family oxidoreductase [Acidobacteriota bacterium]MBI3427129.1 Gfo/Idh/MocA family oxidoreductase [Acidobacteriota bacterium]
MTAKKALNIGLIGYGFMGRAHSNAFLQAGRFFDLPYQVNLKAVCARNPERAQAFAANWGYETVEADWRKLVERGDIDLIDIASPNDTHAEIAIAAAQAGKIVMCEKPLGRTAAEARTMVDAVEAAQVPNMVWYNYRRVPAVTLIKQLLDEGRFGRIFHYRAKFLQDWTISQDLPQGGEGLWRLDVAVAGSGVTGDLLAHNIDTAMWLNGPIKEVSAVTETFIKERKHNLTGNVEPVGIDDASLFLCRFENGSLATFEATRYARGHKALYTLEINGEHCSAFWDLHDLHRLQYFDHNDQGIVRGWRNIHISDGDQPYLKHWWVPGLQIGYEHTFTHQFADFLTAIGEGKECAPNFRDGLATDLVTDAVLKSAQTRQWERVGE